MKSSNSLVNKLNKNKIILRTIYKYYHIMLKDTLILQINQKVFKINIKILYSLMSILMNIYYLMNIKIC